MNVHNSPWTLREIETQWDTLWMDTYHVEPFLIDGSRIVKKPGERNRGHEGVVQNWSVRRSRGTRDEVKEVDKGAVMGGVSLLMMAQNSREQRFLLLGISPSDPTAHERLGMLSTSRVSGGGDLVRLSKEILLHGKAGELENAEWKGKGGVVSQMRTITII
jgi:hypothetical protein